MAIQKKIRGMLISGVMLHDNERSHTAVRTGTLLDHSNWGCLTTPPYSPALAPSDYHLLTYLKNWLRSQRFNNNEELMEGVKTWLNFDTGIKNLFHDTGTSVPAVTTWKNSLSMYVFFIYNNFFRIVCFVNISPEVTFRIALVFYKEISNFVIICFKKLYVCGPKCFAQICSNSGESGRS
jgi:hypothetical protein